MTDHDLAAGSPSAYVADTTRAGSWWRVIGFYMVHLSRNRPCDGRMWSCKGESRFRGPSYIPMWYEACDIMVVTRIKRVGLKTLRAW